MNGGTHRGLPPLSRRGPFLSVRLPPSIYKGILDLWRRENTLFWESIYVLMFCFVLPGKTPLFVHMFWFVVQNGSGVELRGYSEINHTKCNDAMSRT